MTDQWDDIVETLKANPEVEARQKAKNDAIFNAMTAFDAKNASARQGTADRGRLTTKLQWLRHNLIGDGIMKKSYVIAGGAFACVLVVGLMNTSSLTSILPMPADQSEILVKQVPSVGATKPESKAEADKESVADDALSQMNLARGDSSYAPAAPAEQLRAETLTAASPPVMASPAGGVVAQKRMAATDSVMIQPAQQGNDQFEDVTPNSVKVVKDEPVSTFSVDVDTAAYSFVRASINNNVLPQKDAVRVEEMVNYFPYDYAAPKDKSAPFETTLSVYPSPWNKATKLLHIGIKGFDMKPVEQPRSNLVFLLDTSGSMYEPNKLPLLQNSMKLLLDSLQPEDTVSIVTYAGSAGVALEPTKVKDKGKIVAVLDHLSAGGSTAGAEGIRQAYQLAEQNFDKKGVNRVILATDGDFNVGITDPEELKDFVERKRETGVFLSVLGFGRGNLNDALMQKLAQNGNGNAAYIDSLNEARKVLVEEATSTLFPIAKDVKIQVEFNPARVAEYRLIGYETRILNREDFNNDKVDAGDIGAGHTVTAIYEMTPVGSEAALVDDLRYQAEKASKPQAQRGEYAFVKIRYKLPDSSTSKLIEKAADGRVDVQKLNYTSDDTRFATAVAGFAQLLRGDAHLESFGYDDVIAIAQGAKGDDPFGYRAEFINLVRLAKNAASLEPLAQ